MAQVEGLLNHIQFAQAIRPTVFILDLNQLAVTPPVEILYVSEPIVDQAMGFFSHRRLDPAAPIMAAHDDVLYLKYFGRILQDREAISPFLG